MPLKKYNEDINLTIATIKTAMGIGVRELSECLGVKRKNVYQWIRGQQYPGIKNSQKLKVISDVSILWMDFTNEPAKNVCPDVIKLLTNDTSVAGIFLTLRNRYKTNKRKKSNFEKTLEKNNIDINSLSNNNEQFDILTGKSNFFEELSAWHIDNTFF